MKRFLLFLLLASPAYGAAITSAQTGNWSATATWTGGVVPGIGDTATIAHNVTVDVNTTVGTSPNDATTLVLTINNGKNLTVAAGVTFTLRGNAQDLFGAITFGAGSTVTFDASASGGTPVYNWLNQLSSWAINGTSSNPCTFQAVTGQTFKLPGSSVYPTWAASYTTFRRMGDSTHSLHGSLTSYSMSHCTFDTTGMFRVNSTATAGNYIFTDNVWTGTTGTGGCLTLALTGVSASGTRTFARNVFDKYVTYFSTGFSIASNYFGGGFTCVDGAGQNWTSFRLNAVRDTNNSLNGGNGQLLTDSVERNYFILESTIGNPHFIAPSAKQSRNNVISQNVFEAYAPDLVDVGDAILVNNGATSGGYKIIGQNNIVLPSSYPSTTVSSGTLLTLYNNATSVTQWTRNTGNVNLSSTSAGRRGMFAVAEGGTGAAGQVEIMKSNVAWGSTASQGYLGERVSGNVKDIFTVAGTDKNWAYNVSAGDNQRGYEDKVAANTLWTAGDAVAAAVDVNQGTSNPQFFDSTRNLAAWATARGYGAGTYAAALTALQADPTRAADLVAYVFDGYRVQNSAMRLAAHDGGVAGAANFSKTRSTARVTTHRAGLSIFGL